MPKIKMRLELGFYSNDPDGRVELRLVDDGTGMNLARLQMDARQFRDLLGSGGVKVDVDIPSSRFMPLLGADMKVDTVDVPRDVYANDRTAYGGDMPHSVRKYLEQVRDERESTLDVNQVVQVEGRHTNHGWQLIVRTYTLMEESDGQDD